MCTGEARRNYATKLGPEVLMLRRSQSALTRAVAHVGVASEVVHAQVAVVQLDADRLLRVGSRRGGHGFRMWFEALAPSCRADCCSLVTLVGQGAPGSGDGGKGGKGADGGGDRSGGGEERMGGGGLVAGAGTGAGP